MKTLLQILAIGVLAATSAQADLVNIEAKGTVVFRSSTLPPPLGGVVAGQQATLSFQVDSNNFVDGFPGDTRGYAILQPSFVLQFSGGVSVGLLSPFPGGQTPFFTIVEGFPVSDGFFVSTSPLSPGGVPISQMPLQLNLDLGYVGSTLSSLNILDALGSYNFTGLTRFGFNVWQAAPDNIRMDIDFSSLTLTAVPIPVEATTWSGVKALYR